MWNLPVSGPRFFPTVKSQAESTIAMEVEVEVLGYQQKWNLKKVES
jgi:hypothetical protein